MDVFGASLGLALCLPIFALITLGFFFDSRGPILFSQERLGAQGRRFRLWKFRTMIPGAEELRFQLNPLNEAPFPAFKIRRDPRCTRLGYRLRYTSLDELPQLWNVLVGDMSLVGPRPPLPSEVSYYDGVAMRRLDVRPGLTCTWQVADRHAGLSRFDDWVKMDIEYIERWTLRTDLVLLLRTVGVLLRPSGR